MPDLSLVLGGLFNPVPPPSSRVGDDILDATVRPALPVVRPGFSVGLSEEDRLGLVLDTPAAERPGGKPVMPPRLPTTTAGLLDSDFFVIVLALAAVWTSETLSSSDEPSPDSSSSSSLFFTSTFFCASFFSVDLVSTILVLAPQQSTLH